MTRTLLTGANGFVAAHVLDALIKDGHQVTGSVRSLSKGHQILEIHPEYASHLEFVVVSDYAKEGTWDEVFQKHDFDHVIHTAAPLLDDPRNTDFDRDFLEPSVQGVIQLFQSAHKYGKAIKSIVVTGSINAITTGMDVGARAYNSDAWLPVTVSDARTAQNNYISYCVAKAESEKAIWAFMEASKPTFTVTVFLPALIFGPPIQPVTDLKKINYSTDVIYSLFNGTYEVTPPTSFPSYIDVRDLAFAHVKALVVRSVSNQRMIVGGHPYSSQLAVDVLKTIPELHGRIPKDSDEVAPVAKMDDVDGWNAKIGLVIRSPEQTFGDTARKLLELEEKFAH